MISLDTLLTITWHSIYRRDGRSFDRFIRGYSTQKMSSKLVRKGLDLVNSEGSLAPKKRKAIQKGEKLSYRRKQNSSRGNTSKNRAQPRGFKGLSSFSGKSLVFIRQDCTQLAHLPTLPVFLGVSKFFSRSPGSG